jgi:hypothetical protein
MKGVQITVLLRRQTLAAIDRISKERRAEIKKEFGEDGPFGRGRVIDELVQRDEEARKNG